jgi:hypothetical protein
MPSHPKKPPSQLASFNCRRRLALIVVTHRHLDNQDDDLLALTKYRLNSKSDRRKFILTNG